MALGTDFHVDLRLGGSRDELVAAVARHLSLVVLRLNFLLHDFYLFFISRAGERFAPPILAVISENSVRSIAQPYIECKRIFQKNALFPQKIARPGEKKS